MSSLVHRLGNVLGRSVRDEILLETILLVDRNHPRLDGFVRQAERHDDDLVARVKVPGRGAVDDDLAGAARQADGVGVDPDAVVDIPDGDPLAGDDVGAFEQILIDADAADIIDIRAGDDRAMNLRLEDGA